MAFVRCQKQEAVATLFIEREEALNALNDAVMEELSNHLSVLEKDESVRVVILTGSSKAFAAGADIVAMHKKTYEEVRLDNFINEAWHKAANFRKILIAAIDGYALGAGLELAMMCDLIYASSRARLGQPEITLGIIPGVGATQRLPRLVGRTKALELCLLGEKIEANEAHRIGLVNGVFESEKLIDGVNALAQKIANFSLQTLIALKEAIRMSDETFLSAGLKVEQSLFHGNFATKDQKEGMSAFVEKRKAMFNKA